MSKRLIVTGGSRPRELVLVGTIVVGRDPACDINESTDPLLSRRHAAFDAGSRDAIVRDLGSRNGILVNGVKQGESVLRNGDVVQIGHLQVKYVDEVGPFRDVPAAVESDDQATVVQRDRMAETLLADNSMTKKL